MRLSLSLTVLSLPDCTWQGPFVLCTNDTWELFMYPDRSDLNYSGHFANNTPLMNRVVNTATYLELTPSPAETATHVESEMLPKEEGNYMSMHSMKRL